MSQFRKFSQALSSTPPVPIFNIIRICDAFLISEENTCSIVRRLPINHYSDSFADALYFAYLEKHWSSLTHILIARAGWHSSVLFAIFAPARKQMLKSSKHMSAHQFQLLINTCTEKHSISTTLSINAYRRQYRPR